MNERGFYDELTGISFLLRDFFCYFAPELTTVTVAIPMNINLFPYPRIQLL